MRYETEKVLTSTVLMGFPTEWDDPKDIQQLVLHSELTLEYVWEALVKLDHMKVSIVDAEDVFPMVAVKFNEEVCLICFGKQTFLVGNRHQLMKYLNSHAQWGYLETSDMPPNRVEVHFEGKSIGAAKVGHVWAFKQDGKYFIFHPKEHKTLGVDEVQALVDYVKGNEDGKA